MAKKRSAIATGGKLTIFLPLKGRHLHTLRWMWHANRTRLPYHVIIADGEVEPQIARLLEDPTTFPDLSYEYHRHHDHSLSAFYAKCASAIERVTTPYVMICDNDDFVLPTGIEQCLEFLAQHPDHVAATAGIPGFSVAERSDRWNLVTGPLCRLHYRCFDDGSYDIHSFDQPSAAARVRDQIGKFRSLYYSVYRTAAMQTIQRDVRALDPSDLVVHERFSALRALTLGKVHGDTSAMHYLRQGNSSSGFTKQKDWADHLIESRLPQDVRAMAERISSVASEDPEERTRIDREIRESFAAYLRNFFAGTTLHLRFPRLFKVKQTILGIRSALSMPIEWRVARQQRAVFKQLAEDRATQAVVDAHRRELRAIEETLEGTGLHAFVETHAPALLHEQSGSEPLVQEHDV